MHRHKQITPGITQPQLLGTKSGMGGSQGNTGEGSKTPPKLNPLQTLVWRAVIGSTRRALPSSSTIPQCN